LDVTVTADYCVSGLPPSDVISCDRGVVHKVLSEIARLAFLEEDYL
jgi:hypothetical protein